MSTLLKEILIFDTSKPASSLQEQFIATICILVLSTLIFKASVSFFPDKFIKNIGKNVEFDQLLKKNISKNKLAMAEIFNGSLLGPIQEELLWRFLLLKLFLIQKLNLNFHIANIIQATIFGSMHLTNAIYSDQSKNVCILQSVSSGIAGLICGYSYKLTNSILPSLFAHILNNLFASYHQISSYSSYIETSSI
jgi:membrane protease YdiL (CAAX protease family)